MSKLGRLLVGTFLIGIVASGCAADSDQKRREKVNSVDSTSAGVEQAKRPPRYKMELRLIDLAGHFRVKINGFPVEEPATMMRMSGSDITARLNTALVGERNEASVSTMPFLTRSGLDLSIGVVRMRAKVVNRERPVGGAKIRETQVDSVYKEWSRRVRAQWKEYLEWEKEWLKRNPDSSEAITARDGGALDSMRQWAARNPMTVSTTFDNQVGPDFSEIFEEAPKLKDTSATRKRLKDYAIRLRDILRSGDAEEMYRQIRPSIAEETGWFQVTLSGRRDSALAHIREVWMQDFRTDFSRSDVALRPWSGGRVWEFSVMRPEEGRRPFFSEGPHKSHLSVYVAEMDGKLRIVRL